MQPKIMTGKFKGMDRKDVLEIIRTRPKKNGRARKKIKCSLPAKIKNQEEKRYRMWNGITERHSFWVWKGRFSNSPKEKELAKLLIENEIKFYREVSFDMKKRFDFYIPMLNLIIEYDGGQHFKFLGQINNDIIKESILKRLNIRCVRYNKTHDIKRKLLSDLIYFFGEIKK